MAAGGSANQRSRKRAAGEGFATDGAPPARTLKQYTPEEKLDIINFAKQDGNRAAGRKFNVAESSIREWRKNEKKLQLSCALGGLPLAKRCKMLVDLDNGQHPVRLTLGDLGSGSSMMLHDDDSTTTASSDGVGGGGSGDDLLATPSTPSTDTSHSTSPVPLTGSGRRKTRCPRKIVQESDEEQ